MIAKKIPNSKKSVGKASRVSGIANYIVAPELSNGLEKCIYAGAENFMTGTHKGYIAEMTALAQEAIKSKDPIDHWVLSWHSDERPTPAQAKEAIAMFIAHCGLKSHQYIWGLHDDTENLHAHIELCRVHPDTFRVIEINKGFDREAAQQAIALIEDRQGWRKENGARYDIIDGKPILSAKGAEAKAGRPQRQPSSRAIAKEIQTGEKSAERIAIERAAPVIAQAKIWKDVHIGLARIGMVYRRDGSGAKVFIGEVGIKASDVDRKASFGALQKRLGPFQAEEERNRNNDYTATPQTYPVALRKSTGLAPQPLQPGQVGWEEYLVIRDARKAAHTQDSDALKARHSAAWKVLTEQQKGMRSEVLGGDWKGKGAMRNAMASVLATEQAAERAALQTPQAAERKALQIRFPTLPQYKAWKEQPQLVQPLQQDTGYRDSPNVAQTLKALSQMTDKCGHITYRSAGKDVFRDERRSIKIIDEASDSAISAAIAAAQQKFGNTLVLTGSPLFQQKVVTLAAENSLTCRFTDPALNKLREQLQAQIREIEIKGQAITVKINAQPTTPQPEIEESVAEYKQMDCTYGR